MRVNIQQILGWRIQMNNIKRLLTFFMVLLFTGLNSAIYAADNCELNLPDPILTYVGTEDYEVRGNQFTSYRFNVTNSNSFPDELFRVASDLPPCGLNTNSSRTWVDIFESGNRVYGFCGFSESDNLNLIWFAKPRGESLPGPVHIQLNDRGCDVKYTSNTIRLDSPDDNVNNNSDVIYAQSISNRMSIYSGDELADNFMLETGATITGIRFWGGYGIYDVPQQDYFTIHFYNESGSGEPEASPFASFSQLTATRTPTQYLTWPGGTVYEYGLQLPRVVNVQAGKEYYLAFEMSDSSDKWAWSGSRIGRFWSHYDGAWHNSGSYDLAFELKSSPALVDPGNLSESNKLFDCVELEFPEFFSPKGMDTFPLLQYLVRYYANTDTYMGTVGPDAYIYGNMFGGLVYVGKVQDLIQELCSESDDSGMEDIPDFLGIYKGTATNTVFNCNSSINNRKTTSTGNIEISDLQSDKTFSGYGVFSSEVSGFVVEERFDITGQILPGDELTGTANSSAFIDGGPAGSGRSSFTGQINNDEITIQFPQQNVGVDNCISSGTTITVLKQ